ncbi:(2Fe-2S)-binding protein [Amycolatopsis carbonis]|uniref:(2Fe-2S)-binding protein n=1 Tax=Amycolatopsis carbonis TaxID=715471 RepID=A0A9Y2IEY6_9PSEU|nr:(2Fe-2S)-binding protein [Amycolatopsis sp. 2-15]WIX77298.1 (2Fe-2S)-binding protein [Amycolatopsis sp. 2-15]
MLDAHEPTQVSLTVNGKPESARTTPRTTLADFLRHDLGLTGTHLGCEHGVCGACTVRLDGTAVRSCLTLAVQAHGSTVDTVEGLGETAGTEDVLHPLQQKFWEHQALQCGFCTPGFLMAAVTAVEENPGLSRDEIRERLSGNLCRCTGYAPIVAAIAEYAEQVREARA